MIADIWNAEKPYIIAEVSQNHDGSLGQAHAFIDAVATTGANAIKFQTHIAAEESTLHEPFRVKFSYEDKTRYDYWKRMEFSEEQWIGLAKHASDKGLDFLSSPFSEKALMMLDRIGVPAWKFGSGEVFNSNLLKLALNTGKPILLSTGLSTYQDIDCQIDMINAFGNKYVLFQCVTAYPSLSSEININLITELKNKYSCPIGISDHSATIYPSLAAFSLGASVAEVHVTMSEYMFGPDVKASVSIDQLKQIVDGAKFIYSMKQCKFDLNELTKEKETLRKIFSKSVYLQKDMAKGDVITEDDVAIKKPKVDGALDIVENVIGKRIAVNKLKDDPLFMEDVIL